MRGRVREQEQQRAVARERESEREVERGSLLFSSPGTGRGKRVKLFKGSAGSSLAWAPGGRNITLGKQGTIWNTNRGCFSLSSRAGAITSEQGWGLCDTSRVAFDHGDAREEKDRGYGKGIRD